MLFSKVKTFLTKHSGLAQIRDFNFLVKPLWTITNLHKSKPSFHVLYKPPYPSSFSFINTQTQFLICTQNTETTGLLFIFYIPRTGNTVSLPNLMAASSSDETSQRPVVLVRMIHFGIEVGVAMKVMAFWIWLETQGFREIMRKILLHDERFLNSGSQRS